MAVLNGPQRASIIGTGLIGGSIGLALRASGWHVTGVDADPSCEARALELGVIDAIGLDPAATITFVAAPVRAIAGEVKRALAETQGVVTDVGSVKAPVVTAVGDARFVGGHPMAGSEQLGVDGATPDLFEGAVWVLTPVADTDSDHYAAVAAVVRLLGAEVVALEPERHDALVAVVSHVPHLTAAALMGIAGERAEEHAALLRLAAGGFRDMTRIAAGSPSIWPDICAENQVAILEVIDRLTDELGRLRALVADSDGAELFRTLERAQAARRNLPNRVVRPEEVAEIRVPVPDRDGVIAEVATLASELGTNIHDFEVAHNIEGDRGVLIMLVDRDKAEAFREALVGLGYRPSVNQLRLNDVSRLLASLPDPYPIVPIDGPLDADIRVPGSKSITNRALVCAALADGTSTLTGALDADDTRAMVGVLRAAGLEVDEDLDGARITVTGGGGTLPGGDRATDVRQSGTTARFALPLLALGQGRYDVTAHPQMQARPMGTTLDALTHLGAQIHHGPRPGALPVTVVGGTLRGGTIQVAGDASSQFLSGLLLVGPCLPDGLRVEVTTELVSRPYVDLTIAVMTAFGAEVHQEDDRTFVVAPTGYRACTYAVEPDASAASYPLAAAAVCGGRVKVLGLTDQAQQGDVAFAEVLGRLGASVVADATGTEVRAERGSLQGGTFDLTHFSDTAQTLAAVAPWCAEPITVTGIGFIRRKEVDRITAVATELTRCGIDVHVDHDGWTIQPGQVRPAVVQTYDDHRMAMSFALLGLAAPGIAIADPRCVAKTFPGYWDLIERLRPTPTI